MKTKPVIKSSTNTALCSLKLLLLESHALILSWLDRRLLKSSFISTLIWISKGEINRRVPAFSLFSSGIILCLSAPSLIHCTAFTHSHPCSDPSWAAWQPGCARPSPGCSPPGRGCGSPAPTSGASAAPEPGWRTLPRGGRTLAACWAGPRLSWRCRSAHWRGRERGMEDGAEAERKRNRKNRRVTDTEEAAETDMEIKRLTFLTVQTVHPS